ncbi:MAG: glycosyltransferase, partial [Planctomycetaceae bacterium]
DRYRERITAGLRGGDLVVAPTQALLDELNKLYGPLPRRRAIWNGIAEGFSPARFKQPFVLAAGRWWDEAKNLSALADVGPRLSWPVRVAGLPHPDGSDDAPPPGIQFLGRLPRTALADQYARAAIFAHPARYEPFGLTPLEAARSGCALVLGDIATLREVWGDAVRYVPPDDRRALREAIQELIDDPGFRARSARRALTRARQLTAERMAGQYLRAYRELIGTTRRFAASGRIITHHHSPITTHQDLRCGS